MPIVSGQSLKHPETRFLGVVVLALIFANLVWDFFFPGRSSPDSFHRVPVRMRFGAVQYWSAGAHLLHEVLFYASLVGVAVVIGLEFLLNWLRAGSR